MMTEELKNKNDNLIKEYLSLCKKAFACNFIFSFFINKLKAKITLYPGMPAQAFITTGSRSLLNISLIQ